jgi:hypothetical protein
MCTHKLQNSITTRAKLGIYLIAMIRRPPIDVHQCNHTPPAQSANWISVASPMCGQRSAAKRARDREKKNRANGRYCNRPDVQAADAAVSEKAHHEAADECAHDTESPSPIRD